MKQLLFLFVATLLLCTSCGKDDETPEVKPADYLFEVQVLYTTEEITTPTPDSQSKIFVYYGYTTGDLSDYTYDNGILTKEDKTISPDESALTDEEGKKILTIEKTDKPFAIYVESNHREDERPICQSFVPSEHPTGCIINFLAPVKRIAAATEIN